MQIRLFASVLSFSWAVGASSAFAQVTPQSGEGERVSSPGGSASASGGVSVEQASDDQKRVAQESFLSGDKAFDIQDYQTAIEHFARSYATVASPNSRLMIARALLEIGRLDEAYDEYSGVIGDAEGNEDYETTGSTAKKEREALRHRLAWLTVKRGDVPEDSSLMIGGRERTTESLDEPIAVTPGRTAVKATTSDGAIAEAIVHLAAGRAAEVELKLGKTITVGDPPTQPKVAAPQVLSEENPEPSAGQQSSASLKPYAFAAGGVGLLGMAGFATFGTLSKSRYSSLEADCREGICPTSSQNDIDSGKQTQLLANISLGVGVAGVLTSGLLFILDGKKKRAVDVHVSEKSVMLTGAF